MMQHDQNWLNRLNEIIEENISDPSFRLNELAAAIATSPAQLNRKINQLTDLSPRMYVRLIKLTKAKELLELGVYPTVAEVSAAVGYKQPIHFSTIFQKEFGKRPIEYLRK